MALFGRFLVFFAVLLFLFFVLLADQQQLISKIMAEAMSEIPIEARFSALSFYAFALLFWFASSTIQHHETVLWKLKKKYGYEGWLFKRGE